MRSTLQIDNLDSILSQLDAVEDPKGQRDIAKAGLRGGMKPIRKAMRANAPRESGILKRDIRYSVRSKGGQPEGVVGVIPKLSRGKDAQGRERPDSGVIARWIEYGTSAHRIPTRKAAIKDGARAVIGGRVYSRIRHPGITAKPFLRPGLDSGLRQSQREAEKEAHEKFNKIMAKRSAG